MVIENEMKYYLPHREPMLLVDKIIEIDHKFCHLVAELSADRPYLDEHGIYKDHWNIELIAQGAATLFHHRSKKGNSKPKKGFLIAVDSYQAPYHPELRSGDCLELKINHYGNNHLELANPFLTMCVVQDSKGNLD